MSEPDLYRIQKLTSLNAEAESEEIQGVKKGPMPELTIISPYVHSIVDSNTFTMCRPMPESTLSPQSGTLDLAYDLYLPKSD
jgi:hypothetical protein